jgi:Na+/H+-dicarboxylate symporter
MRDGPMKTVARRWFATPLWQRILLALVLGAAFGLLASQWAVNLQWVGELFVRLIRMLIVPLVFVTLVAGITSMGDPKRIGSIGGKAFSLYLVTTFAAIVIGLAMALVFRPGAGVDLSGATPRDLGEPVSLQERLMAFVPDNPFMAFATGDILAVIFFAVLSGAALLLAGERGRPLAGVFDAGSEMMLKMTGIVMEFAPVGVFALIAWVMATEGPGVFISVSLLALAVYLGCFLHILLTYGGMVRLLARLPVVPFFKGAREPQLVAYSTSSSAATLPSTLSAAEKQLGIGAPVASSVLPLGATINMDGTALYVAIITLFAAQAFGVDLSVADYLMIILVTALVSIGTASVPSASLFLMAAVLDVIGMTPAQTALVVGFILPFDRLLDMMRTVANITGDLAVATVVARWEGELEDGVFLREGATKQS